MACGGVLSCYKKGVSREVVMKGGGVNDKSNNKKRTLFLCGDEYIRFIQINSNGIGSTEATM